ncbi:hypothetical protein [Pedobacter nyackensis]|uniref:hypothetical protein n=1 Tax=Pedobacter nyackensis TaxID=475255 RepID=UPI00117E4F04|nr:hypothetical protein [Pedobacter nyackensis]
MRKDKQGHKFEAWLHIRNYIGHIVACEKPKAGLSLWVAFPDAELLAESLSFFEKSGFKVLYFPGSRRPGPGLKYVRFGFGTWNVDEPTEPLKLLCEKLSSVRKGCS